MSDSSPLTDWCDSSSSSADLAASPRAGIFGNDSQGACAVGPEWHSMGTTRSGVRNGLRTAVGWGRSCCFWKLPCAVRAEGAFLILQAAGAQRRVCKAASQERAVRFQGGSSHTNLLFCLIHSVCTKGGVQTVQSGTQALHTNLMGGSLSRWPLWLSPFVGLQVETRGTGYFLPHSY